ncbi:hypothetical protein QQZ08_007951 [Neonectria magnoliae]|uniref:Uncharacterized protein n=1 Tax=Neonectria magnoliae TaxID=2732573 RepID=A0ABR1HXD5_9HYPO
MFERSSLQCLESIAEHPTLSQSVEELKICVSHLLPLHEVQEIEPPCSEYENLMKNLNGRTLPVECGIAYDEWHNRWGISDGEGDANDDERSMGDDETEGPPSDRLSRLNAREYRKRLDDQEVMIQTGYDVECLTRAMSYFKRCKQINISSSIQAWGLNRLRRSLGILPQRGLTF